MLGSGGEWLACTGFGLLPEGGVDAVGTLGPPCESGPKVRWLRGCCMLSACITAPEACGWWSSALADASGAWLLLLLFVSWVVPLYPFWKGGDCWEGDVGEVCCQWVDAVGGQGQEGPIAGVGGGYPLCWGAPTGDLLAG